MLRPGAITAGTYVIPPPDADGWAECPPFEGEGDVDCYPEVPVASTLHLEITIAAGWSSFDNVALIPDAPRSEAGPDGVGLALGWFAAGLHSDPCRPVSHSVPDILIGPTVDDFVDAVVAHPSLDVTDPVDVELGGYSGRFLTLTAPSDISDCTDWRPWEHGIFAQGPDNIWNLWVMDVEGFRFIVLAEEFPETSSKDSAELRAMVDSIRFLRTPFAWTGPVRADADDAVTGMEPSEVTGEFSWRDPNDAAIGWADITNLGRSLGGQIHWRIGLAEKPPVAAELDPAETIIAYGLVFETSGDGVADYVVGIDNDAGGRGDFRVWVTDLATGVTDEQLGPPYGFPVEFSHPDEHRPEDGPRPSEMVFTFLPGSRPPGVGVGARYYAWASVTEGGKVVGWDYAPDAGWLGTEPPDELGCTPLACPMPGPVLMPPGSRQLLVSVENDSERRALLFVAEDEQPMGDLVGTADPAMIPAGATAEVVFTVPPGQGWAIFVNPTPGFGPLVVAHDVPTDASGRVPFRIEIADEVPIVAVPAPTRGWFGN